MAALVVCEWLLLEQEEEEEGAGCPVGEVMVWLRFRLKFPPENQS